MFIWTPGLLGVTSDAIPVCPAGWQMSKQCPCSREPPASPPRPSLCKPVEPQQEAPSWAKGLSNRPQAHEAGLCYSLWKRPFTALRATWGPGHQQLPSPTQGLPGSNLIRISASGSLPCENGPGELGHGKLTTGAD